MSKYMNKLKRELIKIFEFLNEQGKNKQFLYSTLLLMFFFCFIYSLFLVWEATYSEYIYYFLIISPVLSIFLALFLYQSGKNNIKIKFWYIFLLLIGLTYILLISGQASKAYPRNSFEIDIDTVNASIDDSSVSLKQNLEGLKGNIKIDMEERGFIEIDEIGCGNIIKVWDGEIKGEEEDLIKPFEDDIRILFYCRSQYSDFFIDTEQGGLNLDIHFEELTLSEEDFDINDGKSPTLKTERGGIQELSIESEKDESDIEVYIRPKFRDLSALTNVLKVVLIALFVVFIETGFNIGI